jgi:hypothetical protein
MDLSPKKRSKSSASNLVEDSSSNNHLANFRRYISEVSGLERTYDEYDRYEDAFDANANEYWVSSNADIICSETTITDSQGRNKTLVRAQKR